MRRCRWCGRFVPRSTLPMVRVLTVATPARLAAQTLCRDHARAWDTVNPGGHEADPRGLALQTLTASPRDPGR